MRLLSAWPSASRCSPPPSDLPLIKVFVPSLVSTNTRECMLQRHQGAAAVCLYIGYDKGDPTYDDKTAMNGFSNALRAFPKAAPNVNVIFVRYGGEDKGAPCWVWKQAVSPRVLEPSLTRSDDQLNDDLQLRTVSRVGQYALPLCVNLRSSHQPTLE